MIDVYIDPADRGKGEIVSSIRIHWRAPRPELAMESWEHKSAVMSFLPTGAELFNTAVRKIERLKTLIVYSEMEPRDALNRVIAEERIEQRLKVLADMEERGL
jgi:hypothetical protein